MLVWSSLRSEQLKGYGTPLPTLNESGIAASSIDLPAFSFGTVTIKFIDEGTVSKNGIEKTTSSDVVHRNQVGDPIPTSLLNDSPLIDSIYIGNTVAAPQNIANSPLRDKPVSIRFEATSTDCFEEFGMWWRYNSPGSPNSGYSSGNGGRYEIDIQADKNGFPSGVSLEKSFFYPDIANFPNYPNTKNSFRTVKFSGRTCLEKGLYYHVVVKNIDENPTANYISSNGPYLRDRYQNIDEARICENCNMSVLQLQVQENLWIEYPDKEPPSIVYQPYWCISMAQGLDIGSPYNYGHLATNRHFVRGDNRLRQRFILESELGGNIFIGLYVKKNFGLGPLNVMVNGDLVGAIDMEAADSFDIQDGRFFDWHELAVNRTFNANEDYSIEFFSDQYSEYEISTILKVGANRCSLKNEFLKAEHSVDNGSTWEGLTVFAKPDHPFAQLSLYLRHY